MTPAVLVTAHLWLVPVRCRALGLRRSHSAWDDCVQEGGLALFAAAKRFDDERGVAFTCYARTWVDRAIRQHLSTLGPLTEPFKRARDRAARGERAHPVTVPHHEGEAFQAQGAGIEMRHGTRAPVAVQRHQEWVEQGGEDAQIEAIDQRRRDAEVRELLLDSTTVRERQALMGTIGRDESHREYARRSNRARETVRIDVNVGLAKLARAVTAEMGT